MSDQNEVKLKLSVDQGAFVSGIGDATKAIDGMAPAAQKAGEAAKLLGATHEISAQQAMWAWRGLAANMQDAASQLSAGGSPFTVLMQQGAQTAQGFGGVRNMMAAITGAINPLMVGLGGAAAGAVALAVAYNQGSNEAENYTQTLIKTGNQVGMTADRMAEMAKRVGEVAGSQHSAAAAINALTAAGNIEGTELEALTIAAVKWSQATGEGVDEVAKRFSDLGKDPVDASIKLNEHTGFLTVSVLKQIDALNEQGKKAEAARVAQEAYAASLIKNSGDVEASLGSLERGWRSIGKAASAAWSAMLGIGREDTIDDKIKKAQADVASLAKGRTGWFGEKLGVDQDALRAANAELDALQAQKKAANEAADAKAKEAGEVKKLADEIQDREKTRKGPSINREESARVALARAQAAALLKEQMDDLAKGRQMIEADHAQGLTSDQQYYAQMRAMSDAEAAYRSDSLERQIAAESARKTKTDADSLAKQARLVELRTALADTQAQAAIRAAQITAQAEMAALTESRTAAQEWAQAWQQAQQQAEQYADQSAMALASLIADPMKRARAEAEVSAQALERNAERIAQALRVQIDILRSRGQDGMANALQQQLDASVSGAAAAAMRARQEPDTKAFQAFTQMDPGAQLAEGFNKASQSLSAFSRSFIGLMSLQKQYEAARRKAGTDAVALDAVERANTARQISGYATMAAAAKGLFHEQTTGYKVLSGAEKAFRAYELASAIETQGAKLGLWGAETTAKVAEAAAQAAAVGDGQIAETAAVETGETERNAAKTPGVFMAFMSALGPWGMAAAGVAIAAVLGGAFKGSSGSFAASNTGTGTVLGDSSAKSESLKKSIDLLKDVDTLTADYSAQMLASLQSIDSKISGVTTVLLRNGSITTGAGLGISEYVQKNVGDGLLKSLTGINDRALTQNLPILGNLIGGLQRAWGSVSQDIKAAGVQINGALSDVIAGRGMNQYADVATTTKSWFGLSSNTENSTVTAGLDGTVSRQFGLILQGFNDTLSAAAPALGVSLDAIQGRLSNFVVDIGKVDLKGLTGTALTDKLSAVFGAEGDKMAAAALPGFEQFQQIGEGYLETVVRVASATETAGQALSRLGVAAVSVTDVVNKQGDVAAEIVRQSLVANETTTKTISTQTDAVWASIADQWNLGTSVTVTQVSSIGKIMDSLDGTASEMVSTYKSLVDVRRSLVALGIDGEATTKALVAGAGDLKTLTDGLSSYADKFMTTSQKQALGTARMSDAFGALGLSVPRSAQEFRDLVGSVDNTTAAGQELLGGLLSLSSSFADYLDLMGQAEAAQKSASEVASEAADLQQQLLEAQGDTAGVRALELAKLDSSNRALQERIWALQDEKTALEALSSAGQGIVSYINELRGVTGSSASVAALRSTYQAQLAAAQAGDTTASAQVVASAKALVDALRATSTDPLAQARETSRIAAELSTLPATIAYTTQQATATTATTTATAVASALTGSTTTTSQADLLGDLLSEVKALRKSNEALRSDQAAQAAAATAAAVRTARVLENVTPTGNALSVTPAT